MNAARILCAVSLGLYCLCPLHAQDYDPLMTTPIQWNGVEVVTNNFELVERIRSAAAFPERAVMLMSDPKLKTVCDNVRAAEPASTITCSQLVGGGSNAVPQAWYVIEVDIPARPRLPCTIAASALSVDLTSLADEWKAELSRTILATSSNREFVNEADYLDYQSPSLNKLAARIHESVKDRGRELEAAGTGCDPRSRENAFYLMSFAGDPKRYRALAGFHMLDDDAGAANAATRFLLTFEAFIDAAAAPRIADAACDTLNGGLKARNKSLSLLSKLKARDSIAFKQLSAECQLQIRNIARTSRADLVAVPARDLMEGAN